MAHVIITLPKSLWEAIRKGEKTYECRKTYPKIPVNTGRVYVVIKGTHYVAGYFTISHIVASDDAAFLWYTRGSKLAIDEDWFVDYAASAKEYLYLWRINQVYSYEGRRDLQEYFNVKHNPQSFIYTDKEPYIPGTLIREDWLPENSYNKSKKIPITWFYNEYINNNYKVPR